MNPSELSVLLRTNAKRIRVLVENVSSAQASWKPEPESWSILEVINHLYDEERYDFRVRIDYTLHRPGEAWPAIAPQEWVQSHNYQQRDLISSLHDFLDERQASLNWLEDLDSPDWTKSEKAPWGSISAGDLLAAWIAHDTLHMRQLVELHHAFGVKSALPYNGEYAGPW